MTSTNESTLANNLNRLQLERLGKLNKLKENGVNPYPYTFSRTHMANELQEKYSQLPAHTETKDEVRVCGRIMNERNTWMFIDLIDDSGKIQLFCHKESLTSSLIEQLKLLDKGDFIGVTGTIRRTKAGELSIRVTDYAVLCKSLQPLPDGFDAFKDVEDRYRYRHLDLIIHPNVKQNFKSRSKIIAEIRQYLDSHNFLEIETPVLLTSAGGADARPFQTHHNALDIDLNLRIATELYLKRLIIGGFERVYEIGRVFRNEGISTRHNPEFTMLELYAAYGDYNELMDFTENMLEYVILNTVGKFQFEYIDQLLNFTRPFLRISMIDSIQKYCNYDFTSITDFNEAAEIAKKLNVPLTKKEDSVGRIINLIFEELVSPELIQPTFITDYPVEVSPLTKIHRFNSRLTERFELYAYGREIANGYSELTDPIDQKNRLLDQAKLKSAGDEEAMPYDKDFIYAIECGMPPTMGLGIGIDRLVMLLTNSASIRDVIAFPTLKPILD